MLDVTKLLCRPEEVAGGLRAGRAVGHGDRFAEVKRPVAVWNVTRRCNLHCQHCYASAQSVPNPDELSPGEGLALIRELARRRVPALILSGGDPLLRPDLLELIRCAAGHGIHPALSTNGTLIDAAVARDLRAAGVGYVGVSVDGIGRLHHRFRGLRGAWEQALAGLRHCREAGLTVGLRFTLSRVTLPHLPGVLDLMEAEQVHRGYVSHLVYTGRAQGLAGYPPSPGETRAAVGAAVDLAEREVLARLERLRHEGIPRQISAIWDTARLGYRSSLVAASVAPERLEPAAAVVSGHPGVSHNYERDFRWNLSRAVHAEAMERPVWLNVADQPDLCAFTVPAVIRRGDLTVAVSTNGASPAMAARIREELGRVFGPGYAAALRVLRRTRERLGWFPEPWAPAAQP